MTVEENDETLSSETDSEILTADQFTYSDLKRQISQGGNINLTKGTYTYNQNDGNTIEIIDSGVINGNGAVIDMTPSWFRLCLQMILSNISFNILQFKRIS